MSSINTKSTKRVKMIGFKFFIYPITGNVYLIFTKFTLPSTDTESQLYNDFN